MVTADLVYVDNGDGWRLGLKKIRDDSCLDRNKNPVVIVPGYGMNGFIFSYHPKGRSFAETLASRGHEVWIANLRGQAPSVRQGGSRSFGLEDLALRDLNCIMKEVTRSTVTKRDKADLIGASLGGTISYIYLAMADEPKARALVSIGGPLRWESTHPLVRTVFGNPVLAAMVPTMGVRRLAGFVLPKLRFVPWLLSIYLHPELVDLRAAPELVRTIENPSRRLNLQLSAWIRKRDLVISNTNLTQAFSRVDVPLLCVVAVGDGIVPKVTATSALKHCSSRIREVMQIGDTARPYAHADLFVGNDAEQDVFLPVANWLDGLERS